MEASLFTFDFLYNNSSHTVNGTITCNVIFNDPVFLVNWDVERHPLKFHLFDLYSLNLTRLLSPPLLEIIN